MASNYLLKIDNLKGESKQDKHKEWIEVLNFSFGASNPGSAASGGGMGTGKVSFQDFHFTMVQGESAPKLMEFCSTGEHFKEGKLRALKPTGKDGQQQVYYEVTFTDILISSYNTGGGGDGAPIDQVSFNFSKVKMDYKPQKQDGSLGESIITTYDIKEVKKL